MFRSVFQAGCLHIHYRENSYTLQWANSALYPANPAFAYAYFPMPITQRLEILTELRRKRGLSLEQMARYFDLAKKGRDTVSNWERGLTKPSKRRRTKFIGWLCNVLGLSRDQKKLYAVWEILQAEWGWDEELKNSEVQAALRKEDILEDESVTSQ